MDAIQVDASTRPRDGTTHRLETAALVFATVVSAGSLWLSVGLGLKACPLCFYQRSFVFAVAAVLGTGLLAAGRPGLASLLALPLALAGFTVAAYHAYLELAGKLECPPGMLGAGTAPQQSLLGLGIVLALVAGAAACARRDGIGLKGAGAGALVLGLAIAVAAIISAPPMPAPPARPHETPLEMCRPPYRPPTP